MMTTPLSPIRLIRAAARTLLVAGCDKSPLLAPTQSTITVSAGSRVLPPNGDDADHGHRHRKAGTAVQNGTTVRFTATLGRVDPVEAQTHNGVAVTTFFAANSSGVAPHPCASRALASGGEPRHEPGGDHGRRRRSKHGDAARESRQASDRMADRWS